MVRCTFSDILCQTNAHQVCPHLFVIISSDNKLVTSPLERIYVFVLLLLCDGDVCVQISDLDHSSCSCKILSSL